MEALKVEAFRCKNIISKKARPYEQACSVVCEKVADVFA